MATYITWILPFRNQWIVKFLIVSFPPGGPSNSNFNSNFDTGFYITNTSNSVLYAPASFTSCIPVFTTLLRMVTIRVVPRLLKVTSMLPRVTSSHQV